MTDAAPIRITVELRSAREPLAGSVCESDGAKTPFSGWLGLISAIETARAGEPGDEQNRGTRQ